MSRTFFFTDVRVAEGFTGITAPDDDGNDDDDDGTVVTTAGLEPDLFVEDDLLLTIALFDGAEETVVALMVWSVVVVTFPVGYALIFNRIETAPELVVLLSLASIIGI